MTLPDAPESRVSSRLHLALLAALGLSLAGCGPRPSDDPEVIAEDQRLQAEIAEGKRRVEARTLKLQ